MKKLLILGAYDTEIEIINAAKEMGLYTIVTDNNENWDDAPAKKVSDEAWNVSWTDYPSLVEKCMETRIDGVLAGFSERRVVAAETLCRQLGLPFYTIGADLDTIFDKIKFKQACKKSGIQVPEQYDYSNFEDIKYPVIVKPVDNGGSRGISVCYEYSELKKAYEKAKLFSDKEQVLVEEYLSGDEVVVYFTIHDGEIEFSAMCDRHMKIIKKGVTQLPVGYYYPSKYLGCFYENDLKFFIELIKELKIKNGLIGFQCFIKNNRLIPYDPTYRLDGSLTYHIVNKINGINVMKMMIDYSMTGHMGNAKEIHSLENAKFNKIGFTLLILLGKGTIASIDGVDNIREMKAVIHVYQNLYEGNVLNREADFSQIFARIYICPDNEKQLDEIIQTIYSTLKITDEFGNNMVISSFDVDDI